MLRNSVPFRRDVIASDDPASHKDTRRTTHLVPPRRTAVVRVADGARPTREHRPLLNARDSPQDTPLALSAQKFRPYEVRIQPGIADRVPTRPSPREVATSPDTNVPTVWPLLCMTEAAGPQTSADSATGTCLRCGTAWTGPRGGRPRKWCSTACRRAAYEERRAAASGAIAVREVVLERVVSHDHDLTECAKRVSESSGACRRLLRALLEAREVAWGSEPRWDAVRQLLQQLADERARYISRSRGYFY